MKNGLLIALLLGTMASSAFAKHPHAALKASPISSPDDRARQMLSKMTLDEKLTLLEGVSPFFIPAKNAPTVLPRGAGYTRGIPRLGIPALGESDASLGVANMGGVMRLHDVATALPSGLALAATWNADLAEQSGAAIAAEARAKGFNVLLAGGVNLTREPRNGRNFEYLGEDPLLAGTLAGHSIRGIQSQHVISTIKHFALNAQEVGRGILSADMPEPALRESDLLAFQIGIEIGKPGSVMCAYNKVNSIYACENSFLLNDVLRRNWGFKGWVMSDWGAVHGPSIHAGLDQESGTMPNGPHHFGTELRDAITAGKVSIADVDRSVLRMLRTMYAVGVTEPAISTMPIDFDAHGKIAQNAAEQGIVLLKNDGGLLPIAKTARNILIVGGHADAGVLAGGGSSQVNPVGGASFAEAIPGGAIYSKKFYMGVAPVKALRDSLPQAQITFDDGSDPARAAIIARKSDLVVIVAEQFTAEGFDVETLDLPNGQDELIEAVAATNSKTVVVLETGGPVLMPWLDRVGAVVAAWYPGQRGGQAIARILSGEVNPSGRLPITFPCSIEQTPNPILPGLATVPRKDGTLPHNMSEGQPTFHVTYPEGADVGYRWYEKTKAKPLFAFGHGLSYTSFKYDALAVKGGSTLTATFRLTNTGKRAGIETAQVYARLNGVRRLVGWKRIELAAGQSRQVQVIAEPRLLATFDAANPGWQIAGGAVQVEVSAASDEPRLTRVAQLSARRMKP